VRWDPHIGEEFGEYCCITLLFRGSKILREPQNIALGDDKYRTFLQSLRASPMELMARSYKFSLLF
jgi:hypothetical protein